MHERFSSYKPQLLPVQELNDITKNLKQWIIQGKYREEDDPTVAEILKMANDCKIPKGG